MDKNQPIDWRRVVSAACLKCDWTALARTALGSPELAAMVGEAFRMIGSTIERDIARAEAVQQAPPQTIPPSPVEDVAAETAPPPPADPEPPLPKVDERVVEAAALLGVEIDASEDEIRAALRARLSSSRVHPDHGGDADEAKRLIAAKNLLIERAKAARV